MQLHLLHALIFHQKPCNYAFIRSSKIIKTHAKKITKKKVVSKMANQMIFLLIGIVAFFGFLLCTRKDNYSYGSHNTPMGGNMGVTGAMMPFDGGYGHSHASHHVPTMPFGHTHMSMGGDMAVTGAMMPFDGGYGHPHALHHALGGHSIKRFPITTVTTNLCNPYSGICSLSVDSNVQLVDGSSASIIITKNSLGLPAPIIIAGTWSTQVQPSPVFIYNPQTISPVARAFVTMLQRTRSTNVVGTINGMEI